MKNQDYISIREIKGIGPKMEATLGKIGIYSVCDLLEYYPRTYDIYELYCDIDHVEEGKIQAVKSIILERALLMGRSNLQFVTLFLKGDTQTIKLVWYRMPFLTKTLKKGICVVFRGLVQNKSGQLVMEQPEIYYEESKYLEKIGSLQPIYTLTKGISNQLLTKSVKSVMEEERVDLSDPLPLDVVEKYGLCPYKEAIFKMHFPKDKDDYAYGRSRIVFQEFLKFIISLQSMKENKSSTNELMIPSVMETDILVQSLPYELTNAQKKVWNEIQQELNSDKGTMSRLIQGDVGSGKTVLALLSLIQVVANGYQGAMMAPTEVLARQHFQSIQEQLNECGLSIQVTLLTGSMKAKEKRETYKKIESGEAQIIIGTHALIQDKVNYHKLALVITDEQHRFGVKQRETLAEKGIRPHILVMSATPIPRTLAMILYGDLDISVLDEVPANRLAIKNCVVDISYRPNAYEFIAKQVELGRQAYVICPMVEESENSEGENVIDYATKLQNMLGESVHVAYLHGRMKQSQKDDIMLRYSNREIEVLVSTTVIEVGINVPNATVMMIENAERFGLSALHQLRGRVGRGKHQSYCIFMSTSKNETTKKRLEILGKSNDGFLIANEDLKQRGPGDLFGIRQSGLLDFKVADVFQDAKILQNVAEAIKMLDENQRLKFMEKQEINTSVIL